MYAYEIHVYNVYAHKMHVYISVDNACAKGHVRQSRFGNLLSLNHPWGLKFLTERMKVEHYFRNEFLLVRTGASLKVRTVQCSTTKPCPTTAAVVYSREPPYTSTNPSLDAHAGKPFPTPCGTAAADISISVYHRNHRWRPLHVSTSRVQSRISIG
jgi:hypothetical protein